MLPWKRRCVPRLLRDRIPCGTEDFVGRYFPSGPRRDAARRLWRFIVLDQRGQASCGRFVGRRGLS